MHIGNPCTVRVTAKTFAAMTTFETLSLGSGVICHQCSSPIPLQTTERISLEFCVACPRCGRRHIYRHQEIKPLAGIQKPTRALAGPDDKSADPEGHSLSELHKSHRG